MDWMPFVVIGIWGLWMWWENKEDERRRTRPERARKATRDLELGILVEMDAEDWLRRLLILELKAVHDRRIAQDYLREHYGIEPPPPMPSLWPWPLSKWLTR